MAGVTTFIDRMKRKGVAYQAVFLDQRGEATAETAIVLADLMRFCRMWASTVTVSNGRIDPLAMALAEGRREVILHIHNMLKLSDRAWKQIVDDQ